jgi:pSer/pThr/pTyr-binding forkhead associated (FHA) protein
MVIGRGAGNHLVLDDELVSRRHAQIVLSDDAAVIEDFGSINGVYVNEKRITGPQRLASGDRIVIGQQEMTFRTATSSHFDPSRKRLSAETLQGGEAFFEQISGSARAPARDRPTNFDETGDHSESPTRRGDAIDLLGGVADKVLALGRGEEAERILASFLLALRDGLRRKPVLQPDMLNKAAGYAVKLAGATGKGQWFDYTVELYTLVKRPMPASVVDELYTVVRKVSNVSVSALREYGELLRTIQASLSPSDRFVAQRFEGLVRLAALK